MGDPTPPSSTPAVDSAGASPPPAPPSPAPPAAGATAGGGQVDHLEGKLMDRLAHVEANLNSAMLDSMAKLLERMEALELGMTRTGAAARATADHGARLDAHATTTADHSTAATGARRRRAAS